MAAKTATQIGSYLKERIAALSTMEPNQGLVIPKTDGLPDEELMVIATILGRKKTQYPGVHVVYSGLNKSLKNDFGKDPRKVTGAMHEKGIVIVSPARGGAFVRLPGVEKTATKAAKKGKATKAAAPAPTLSPAVRKLIG